MSIAALVTCAVWMHFGALFRFQSVFENKYDHLSAIYHLLVDRCKKHQAAIAAGQSATPTQQPATNSSISPTHLPIAAKFSSERRRSSITTGIGQSFRPFLRHFCCFYDEIIHGAHTKKVAQEMWKKYTNARRKKHSHTTYRINKF